MNSDTYVKMEGITKIFGTVKANSNINFEVKKGEIYALLGENGAGKSTLMNMLSGIYMPDSGSIYIHGKKVNFKRPKDAINAGIGMIHQHFKLVDIFTGIENILLGSKGSIFKTKKVYKKIDEIAEQFGFKIDLTKKVYNMSVGEKQTVEILKVLYRGADILILDEPTAVLTPQEIENLFIILKKMRAKGCSIIIITHKLNEVMAISDKVTVLRKGESVSTVKSSETTPKELTDLMVGEEVDLKIEREKYDGKKEKLLEVKEVTVLDSEGVKKLDKVSLCVMSGEIVGVAGVAGSGQRELCEVIAGIEKVKSGDILYEGKTILGKSCRDIMEQGITMSFIPEDRLGMGLVGSMDIVENVILKEYYKQSGVFLSKKEGEEKAEKIVKKLEVSTPGIKHPVKMLSGGNIQKVLLGRELEYNPHLIVTAYATRGVDIGASHIIYDLLNEQKRGGTGILFIGEDLDVLIELTDRIVVMCDGKITGELKSSEATREKIGFLMAGETLEMMEKNV